MFACLSPWFKFPRIQLINMVIFSQVLECQKLLECITEIIWSFFVFSVKPKISDVKVTFEHTKRARFQKPSFLKTAWPHDDDTSDRKWHYEFLSFMSFVPYHLNSSFVLRCSNDVFCLQASIQLRHFLPKHSCSPVTYIFTFIKYKKQPPYISIQPSVMICDLKDQTAPAALCLPAANP